MFTFSNDILYCIECHYTIFKINKIRKGLIMKELICCTHILRHIKKLKMTRKLRVFHKYPTNFGQYPQKSSIIRNFCRLSRLYIWEFLRQNPSYRAARNPSLGVCICSKVNPRWWGGGGLCTLLYDKAL